MVQLPHTCAMCKLDTTRVARLLLQDSVPTLGERAVAEVNRLAANSEALAREWIDGGLSVADAWWCHQDRQAIAPLGALANIRPPAS